MICTDYQILFGSSNREYETGGACSAYAGEERCTGFCWGNLRERNHLGNPGVDGRIIIRRIFSKSDVCEWTGWSWLRIGTDSGHL